MGLKETDKMLVGGLGKNRQDRLAVAPPFPAQCHLPGTSPVLGYGTRASSPTVEPNVATATTTRSRKPTALVWATAAVGRHKQGVSKVG